MTESKRLLDVQGVRVSYGGYRVLDDLDFSLGYGELRFLIGPSGAGKTTLLDLISGKVRPDCGRVIFDGVVDVERQAEHTLMQLGIARKLQTPSIFDGLTVYENLQAAAGLKHRIVQLLAPADRADREKIEAMLDTTGLRAQMACEAGLLEHGERQWLEIGMLMMQEPKLLLLDEPLAGMNRAERERTGELLRAIGCRCAILVVEQDPEFVRCFANTVTVLHAGRVLCEGAFDAVTRDQRVIEVYPGRADTGAPPNSTNGTGGAQV